MSLNETPQANRLHIAFFGRRNVGKSSLVNAITGQELAVVSPVKGTTTDPVYKSMELLPLGPVVIIDTPGFDDEGELGELRIQKAQQVLRKTDIAVLVLDGEMQKVDEELLSLFKERNIPYIIVQNKIDLTSAFVPKVRLRLCERKFIPVNAKTNHNIDLLKEKLAALKQTDTDKHLVADLIRPNDIVVLVIPIDSSAPKGRLILPQQQMIRDILDAGGCAVCVKESELAETLKKLGVTPALVITDSQVFAQVSAIVPQEIPLTSFSILFARYKGFLETAVKGAAALDNLQESDKILICEGCTHHRQCDDIGTVKIPRLIKNYAKIEPEFSFCSGGGFPDDLSSYKVVIHCGGCMLNEREMQYRSFSAQKQGVPFTNYGVVLEKLLSQRRKGAEGIL